MQWVRKCMLNGTARAPVRRLRRRTHMARHDHAAACAHLRAAPPTALCIRPAAQQSQSPRCASARRAALHTATHVGTIPACVGALPARQHGPQARCAPQRCAPTPGQQVGGRAAEQHIQTPPLALSARTATGKLGRHCHARLRWGHGAPQAAQPLLGRPPARAGCARPPGRGGAPARRPRRRAARTPRRCAGAPTAAPRQIAPVQGAVALLECGATRPHLGLQSLLHG